MLLNLLLSPLFINRNSRISSIARAKRPTLICMSIRQTIKISKFVVTIKQYWQTNAVHPLTNDWSHLVDNSGLMMWVYCIAL